MKNGYIALYDSGVGGISVLKELIKVMPNENYLYLGDNENAPYGNKNVNTLKNICFKNIDYIKSYNVKALVVACNTLSVNLLSDIAIYSGLPTFGVFPPVERCLMNGEKTLLLSTLNTAKKYKTINNLFVVGLYELAKDIEDNLFSLDNVNVSAIIQKAYNENNLANIRFDTVILGCTHYNFVKNKIFDHLKPQKIICGELFTVKKVYEFLATSKLLVKHSRNRILFIGKNYKNNKNFFKNVVKTS